MHEADAVPKGNKGKQASWVEGEAQGLHWKMCDLRVGGEVDAYEIEGGGDTYTIDI